MQPQAQESQRGSHAEPGEEQGAGPAPPRARRGAGSRSCAAQSQERRTEQVPCCPGPGEEQGAGTDEKTLTRIMVSRSEINLLNRRREFIEKYDKSLHQAIEGDTSGHFLKALLAICGGED
ncbi:hypothetical protein AB1E18_001525 [Capra hircus]